MFDEDKGTFLIMGMSTAASLYIGSMVYNFLFARPRLSPHRLSSPTRTCTCDEPSGPTGRARFRGRLFDRGLLGRAVLVL